MNDKFFMGVILGMLGGAIITTNSAKARQMVIDGQTEVSKKVSQMAKPKKSNQSN
jgi:hypothetical protein